MQHIYCLKKILLTLFLVGLYFTSKAQDPHFSQFYANPIYINPSLAGTTEQGRFSFNYRAHWAKLPGEFVTYNLAYDHSFEQKKSSIGFIMQMDRAGSAGVRSFYMGGMYAYTLQLQDELSLKAGFQLGYGQRSLQYLQLVFGDQLNNFGSTGSASQEQNIENLQVNYLDLAAGFTIYSNDFWFGVAAHHLNEPNYTWRTQLSTVPMKISAHGGYRYKFTSRSSRNYSTYEFILHPAFYYSRQGNTQNLDVGLNFIANPMVFGLWYRDVPLGDAVASAVVLMTGFEYNGFNFLYSYDMPVGQVSAVTGGSHEITLALKLDYDYNYRSKGKRIATFPSLIE